VSTVPTFSQKINTGPVAVLAGSTETINFSLTDTGIDFSNGIADREINDSKGKKVAQQSWTGQNWTTGQPFSNTFDWPVPATLEALCWLSIDIERMRGRLVVESLHPAMPLFMIR
jgi:hypothetical protein